MMSRRLAPFALLALTLAVPVRADDTGRFVVRLGDDTTSVESYKRSKVKDVIEQVGRAPRVLRRHIEYKYASGQVRHMSMIVTAPGATAPTQTVEVDVPGDSVRIEIVTGSAPPNRSAVSLPAGTLIVAGSSPWVGYETRTMRLVKSKADSLTGNMYFIGGGQTVYWLRLRRLGPDSVRIENGHEDVYHARVDKDGRILGIRPISGTAKFSVERVANLDVDAVAASFAAREQAGGAMGLLSPRDSVVTTAGGASLWIDYGRPGKRGRAIFGEVVPFGEVWRTGANAATQFRTDKALDFGGVVVPAGMYTLWTVPSATGWKLIVNSETGQWGTQHKSEKDLFTIPMSVSALGAPVERFTIAVDPSTDGGTLRMEWDTTRASVPFVVKP